MNQSNFNSIDFILGSNHYDLINNFVISIFQFNSINSIKTQINWHDQIQNYVTFYSAYITFACTSSLVHYPS